MNENAKSKIGKEIKEITIEFFNEQKKSFKDCMKFGHISSALIAHCRMGATIDILSKCKLVSSKEHIELLDQCKAY